MTKRPARTAGEILAELEQDPQYIARMEELERQRAKNRQTYLAAAAPMLMELAEAGFSVESLDDFVNSNLDYREAIPILLRWLPLIQDRYVRESIVRSLTIKAARPAAAPALVQEFQREQPSEFRWVVGNALSVVADDSVFDSIVELVRDKRHAKAREMLAPALANMKDPRAIDVLIELLGDEEVAGHALWAVRKLGKKAARARPDIAPFLSHPKTWVRNEAKRALAKIDKAG